MTKPQNIQLGIRADGEIFWNGEIADLTTLDARMKTSAAIDPQPELHIRADRTTEYRRIAEVMSAAARAGLGKIGFVTEPGEATANAH